MEHAVISQPAEATKNMKGKCEDRRAVIRKCHLVSEILSYALSSFTIRLEELFQLSEKVIISLFEEFFEKRKIRVREKIGRKYEKEIASD